MTNSEWFDEWFDKTYPNDIFDEDDPSERIDFKKGLKQGFYCGLSYALSNGWITKECFPVEQVRNDEDEV